MRFMQWAKDGGPQSHVDAFYVVEIKSLFSIMVLRFADGTRDAYHSHAFNAVSWLLKGHLREFPISESSEVEYRPSFRPIVTMRTRFHQVASVGISWALTFRGPWAKTWKEVSVDGYNTLTHGRVKL